MSQDPDRYDPARDAEVGDVPVPGLPLDPALDPDRFAPPGQGQTLTDLLGKAGAQEEERDNLVWALGLVAVFGFLGLVAFVVSRMSPG